ncbi:MAG: type IV secretion system DNA-binding domain-containing protein [Oscillospiraceae bacterium]|jgi:type IV secretory pathway TraG/TraD family ATPase VirD4|nr:type IV secretion system DNA-binding domain-containing protein [Oscillospiraceae bacterium]
MENLNARALTEVVEGQRLQNMPFEEGEISIFSGRGNAWRFNPELLSSHFLAIGGIGTGKTNLLYHIVKAVIDNITLNDIVIFFDSKGDFLKRFYRQGDYVIGNSHQYSNYNLSKWNIYKELAISGSISREDTIREVSTSLFKKRIDSAKDPTFANGARDIFAAIIEAQFRSNSINQNNATLKQTFRSIDISAIKKMLENHQDLKWINVYMHNEGSSTTQSFLSPLGSVVNDVFSAHFAESGNFSIREAIQQRSGKSVFLEYDIVNSNLLDSVYTVLLDLASKDALGNESRDKHVYFILDEFPLIPKLNYIDNLLNFGRSRGIRVIAGIQNINQVKNMYDASLGMSVLSGFSTCAAFRLFDEESRKFVADRHGKNRKIIRLPYTDSQRNGEQEYERGSVVEDWDITTLQRGECIVSLPNKNPYLFFPALYPEPMEKITIGNSKPKIQLPGGNS